MTYYALSLLAFLLSCLKERYMEIDRYIGEFSGGGRERQRERKDRIERHGSGTGRDGNETGRERKRGIKILTRDRADIFFPSLPLFPPPPSLLCSAVCLSLCLLVEFCSFFTSSSLPSFPFFPISPGPLYSSSLTLHHHQPTTYLPRQHKGWVWLVYNNLQ